MSEKLLDTVSGRICPELHQQIALLANLDGLTVSSLITHLLTDYAQRKYALHLQLSRAFGTVGDLQDIQGKLADE